MRAPLRSLESFIVTQGTTGGASKISVRLCNLDGTAAERLLLRVRVCDNNGFATATNATIAPTDECRTVETHTSTKDLTISSPVLEGAIGTLTVSGVVIDAQTVTIGSRVYEFDTHATATITSGRVRVNISASATAAAGTLTLPTQPTAGDTMTIGAKVYTFVAAATANEDGEINLGANIAATKPLVVAAINGTDGINTAHPLVSAAAFSADTSVITALAGGVAGNSIVSTETFTAGGNVFDAATLGTTTAGTDCSAANAITALVAAINGDASRVVDATDGAGDTMTVVAVTGGFDANAYATTETMTNGAWGSATLTGGNSDSKGLVTFTVTNATAESVTLRFGPAVVSPASDVDWTATRSLTHAAP